MTNKNRREIDRAVRQYQQRHPGTSLSDARRAVERIAEHPGPAPSRLPHVVLPRAGESLVDWIDRLAEANGARRHQMMERLGLEPGRSANERLRDLAQHMPDHTARQLHEATGIDAELAHAMAAVPPSPSRSAPEGPLTADQAADRLHQLLAEARSKAEAEGLPASSSWNLQFIEPQITRLRGAAALRTAAKKAARRLRMSVRVTVYRPEGHPEQLITVNNQGPYKTVKRDPVDTLVSVPFEIAPLHRRGPQCDCGRGYCLSGTDTGFGPERWPEQIWDSIRPDTDLRTLPDEYRTTFAIDVLFAQLKHRDFRDSILDLTPFLEGAELGPLADVQVYATNARGHYRGRSHGAVCQHADTREGRGFGPRPSERHEILSLAELVETLRPLHHSRQRMGLSSLIGPGAARRDRDLEERWCTSCGGYSVRRFTSAEQCAHYLAEHERWSQRVDHDPDTTAEANEDEARAQELLSKMFGALESPGVLRIFDAHDRAMGIVPDDPHERP